LERRLVAILAADIVGYSRLMGQDEAGTLAALKALRADVLDPRITEHKGRIFKATGDGVLVEFPSVVNAVACAVDIQQAMAIRNADLSEDRMFQFRIGVNIGDVIVEGEDIFGDGVNIAARLEGIAPAGGVVVSGTARDHLGNRLDLQFEDLGEETLKNIDKGVKVYRVSPREFQSIRSSAPDRSRAKLSVAILPFTNMSADADQQYFSDGITEDIITELSRFQSLFVIARHSSFQYRDKSVDVRRVARELAVQYIVEGSVRRSGNRLRITAQLIDAMTGDHVWADRYDRDIEDVFAVQDDVAGTIAATLEGRVVASAAERVKQKPSRDWKAYDYFLKGRERDVHDDLTGAEALYARAAELDPTYSHAHAFRAIVLAALARRDFAPELMQRAQASAQLALSLDPHDAWGHQAAGYIAVRLGKFELAGVHLDRALNLNPNDLMIAADHANWLVRTGKSEEALQRIDAAMKRDPFPATWIWEVRFRALFQLRRYNEAIAALNHASAHGDRHYAYLAATCAHLGRIKDAQAAVRGLLQEMPAASVTRIAASEPYSSPHHLDHLIEGLRKAGLPD